jgi:Amt family ammonium transporter
MWGRYNLTNTSSPVWTPCTPRAGDIAWMLMATGLVLGMFPGVAFFELGLLRKKNTTSILAQIFCGLPILSTMWIMFGYSLTFGPDAGGAGVIGDFSRAWFAKLSFDSCFNGDVQIPEPLYGLFQLMFACITPLLMTGSFAERLAWKPFIFLMIFWEILVYYPIAHWMWSENGWLNQLGAQDFAGGIVIHTTAGVSALVICKILGKRHNFKKYGGNFPYSSLPLAGVGATLLWTGWFGFNGGSALGANSTAISAVLNSQIGASVSAVVLVCVVWKQTGKPSTIAMLNGAIAGLAGITPASGFITPVSAFVLGVLLGASVEVGVHFVKHKWEIDDALDVSVVHGLTGIIGSLYIGIAGDASISGANGLVATAGTDWMLMGVQTLAVVIAAVWAGFWSFVIMMVIRRFTPLRISHVNELRGLDAAIHFETASFADSEVAFGHGNEATHLVSHGQKDLRPEARMSANNNNTRASLASAPLDPNAEDSEESDDEAVQSDIRPSENEVKALKRSIAMEKSGHSVNSFSRPTNNTP